MSSLLPLLLELMGLLKLQDTPRSQLKLTLRVDLNIGKGWEAKIEGPRYLSEIIATTGDLLLCFHMHVTLGIHRKWEPKRGDGEAVGQRFSFWYTLL